MVVIKPNKQRTIPSHQQIRSRIANADNPSNQGDNYTRNPENDPLYLQTQAATNSKNCKISGERKS